MVFGSDQAAERSRRGRPRKLPNRVGCCVERWCPYWGILQFVWVPTQKELFSFCTIAGKSSYLPYVLPPW